MKSLLIIFLITFVMMQLSFSQPTFTSYGEIKVSQSPADDSPSSIAVNEIGTVIISYGNRIQTIDHNLGLIDSTYTNDAIVITPFIIRDNELIIFDRYDSTLRLTGIDASISIYSFKHFFGGFLLDTVTVLIAQHNYEDYIYPMEYEWSVPVNVRAINTGKGFYAFLNLYYEMESNLPNTVVRNFHYLFFWNPLKHELKKIFLSDPLAEATYLNPVQDGWPQIQKNGISNALLSDINVEKAIFYRRIQKRTRFYTSNPLKYLRTVKFFNGSGDSLSTTVIIDSVDASLFDLSERIIIGDADSFFIIGAKYPSDTLFVEHFDRNGVSVGALKPLLNEVRFFIDLKSHRKSIARLDTIPRLRKADYQIAGLRDGRFVLIWSHQNVDSTTDVYAGLLDENMNWLGPPKRINSDTTGNHYSPSIALKGDTVYVAWIDTRDGSRQVYMRRFQADQITDVKNEEMQPTQFAIKELYPNPFRESTTITFTLSHVEKVGVRVYDFLGREVKTLFEGEAEAGEHSVQFNANDLPSGVYQVVLQSGKNIVRKNIVVMR